MIPLGPLMLNFELIIFILSSFIGYLALKFRLSRARVDGRISDKFVTALILGFMIWKFSLIIFDPLTVIRYPMSLLYFNGGDKGLWLAIAISILFLWMRSRKEGTSVWINLDIMSTGLIAGSGTYHLMLLTLDSTNKLFLSLYICLAIGLLIFMYTNKNAIGNRIVMNQIVIWFSLGMIGLFFTEKERRYLFFSFSIEQVIFILLFIIAIFVGNALEKKKGEGV
ncbi:MAG: hypothetical protein WDZ91_06400 [Paenibacillaceae bacterium]